MKAVSCSDDHSALACVTSSTYIAAAARAGSLAPLAPFAASPHTCMESHGCQTPCAPLFLDPTADREHQLQLRGMWMMMWLSRPAFHLQTLQALGREVLPMARNILLSPFKLLQEHICRQVGSQNWRRSPTGERQGLERLQRSRVG